MLSCIGPPLLGLLYTLFYKPVIFAPLSYLFFIFALIFEKLRESLIVDCELFVALPCLYTLMFMPRLGIAYILEFI